MTTDDELMAIAKAVKPKHWSAYTDHGRANGLCNPTLEVQDSKGRTVVAWMGFDGSPLPNCDRQRVVSFIAAADPFTVFDLLTRLRTAEAALVEKDTEIERLRSEQCPRCEPLPILNAWCDKHGGPE